MSKAQCRRQKGVTLISTMIGLMIGLLSVLAIFNVYLIQVRQVEGSATAAGSRQMAVRNGQLALSLVLLQTQMQQAGFRMPSPAIGTNLVTVSNAAGQITALGWNWSEAGVIECAAMRYVATANVGVAATERGRVDLLRRVTPCTTSPANPTTLFTAAAAANIEVLATDIPRLGIAVAAASASCVLGTDPDPSTVERGARVEFLSSLSLAGLPVRNQFCIYNIVN